MDIDELIKRGATSEQVTCALLSEIETLRRQLEEKDEVIAEAGEMLAERDKQLAAANAEIDRLNSVIESNIDDGIDKMAIRKIVLKHSVSTAIVES